MNDASRDRILSRLHTATKGQAVDIHETPDLPIAPLDMAQKIEKLKTLMEAVRTEVHVIENQDWIKSLKEIIKKRNL
ncbi:MAG: hypothetical protein PVI55_13950, partial [Desulfobacterales bacterium]